MSNALLNEAFKAMMPTTQKFVFIALCDYANDAGECFPSVTQMMERCCMSDRSVQRGIAELERMGYLRRGFRRGRSTVYVVTDPASWPCKQGGAPTTQSHPDTLSPRHRVTPEATYSHPDTVSPPTDSHHAPDTVSGAHDTLSPITTTQPSLNPERVYSAGEREADSSGSEAPATSTPIKPAVRACMAMIAAGIPAAKVSANHPTLVQLIAEGRVTEDFASAAAYALEQVTPESAFAYALGIVRRQANAPPRRGAAKPAANDNFEGKNYAAAATAIDQLSPELRAAVERAHAI